MKDISSVSHVKELVYIRNYMYIYFKGYIGADTFVIYFCLQVIGRLSNFQGISTFDFGDLIFF